MKRLREAMERLVSAAGVAETGRLAQVLEPEHELADFDQRLARLREEHPVGEANEPPRLDVDDLWERWELERPNIRRFSIRELRALCWDHRAAGDRVFVDRLVNDGLIPTRTAFLRGLWHAHQAHWRLSTSSNIEELVAQAACQRGYRPRWLASLQNAPDVMSTKAPQALARHASGDWTVRGTLDQFGVTPTGHLGRQGVEQTIQRWIEEVARRSKSGECSSLIEAGHAELLHQELIDHSRFGLAVQELLALVPQGTPAYRAAVAGLILSDSRLGHPKRVATRGNWVRFRDSDVQIAVQLFAARDLRAFFEILVKSVDDYQERRKFWERYVESPQLVDFAIACDPDDMRLLRARAGSGRAQAARMTNAPSGHSAFLMRFVGRRDILVAEMSQPNNAMFAYSTDAFEGRVGSLSDERFNYSALRDDSIVLKRMIHSAPPKYWHDKFEAALAQWGVRPGRAW